ncbi:MAG: acyltransferase [Clostridiales bacterium]|nr:acyltransferase [Clostridiales bacterium]
MGSKSGTRESGIELLRILAAMAVVLLHYNDPMAFDAVAGGSPRQYILFLLESMAICAVDLFIVISGFFLSGTQKRSFRKLFELIFQVIFYREVLYLLTCVLSHKEISLSTMAGNMIPNNYFIILYGALYLISPFINISLRKLDSRQWKILMVVMVCVFSLWNIAVDLGEEILGYEISGISTFSQKGSIRGFNIMNFCLAYVIGAYLRYGAVPAWMEKKRNLGLAWLGTVLLIFLWSIGTEKLVRLELRSAWMYHNPLVLLSAALLFQFFRQIRFRNRTINRMAGAAFSCFLVHGKVLEFLNIQKAVSGSILLILGHIAFALVTSYMIAWIAYECYSLVIVRLLNKLNLRVFKPWSIDI